MVTTIFEFLNQPLFPVNGQSSYLATDSIGSVVEVLEQWAASAGRKSPSPKPRVAKQPAYPSSGIKNYPYGVFCKKPRSCSSAEDSVLALGLETVDGLTPCASVLCGSSIVIPNVFSEKVAYTTNPCLNKELLAALAAQILAGSFNPYGNGQHRSSNQMDHSHVRGGSEPVSDITSYFDEPEDTPDSRRREAWVSYQRLLFSGVITIREEWVTTMENSIVARSMPHHSTMFSCILHIHVNSDIMARLRASGFDSLITDDNVLRHYNLSWSNNRAEAFVEAINSFVWSPFCSSIIFNRPHPILRIQHHPTGHLSHTDLDAQTPQTDTDITESPPPSFAVTQPGPNHVPRQRRMRHVLLPPSREEILSSPHLIRQNPPDTPANQTSTTEIIDGSDSILEGSFNPYGNGQTSRADRGYIKSEPVSLFQPSPANAFQLSSGYVPGHSATTRVQLPMVLPHGYQRLIMANWSNFLEREVSRGGGPVDMVQTKEDVWSAGWYRLDLGFDYVDAIAVTTLNNSTRTFTPVRDAATAAEGFVRRDAGLLDAAFDNFYLTNGTGAAGISEAGYITISMVRTSCPHNVSYPWRPFEPTSAGFSPLYTLDGDDAVTLKHWSIWAHHAPDFVTGVPPTARERFAYEIHLAVNRQEFFLPFARSGYALVLECFIPYSVYNSSAPDLTLAYGAICILDSADAPDHSGGYSKRFSTTCQYMRLPISRTMADSTAAGSLSSPNYGLDRTVTRSFYFAMSRLYPTNVFGSPISSVSVDSKRDASGDNTQIYPSTISTDMSNIVDGYGEARAALHNELMHALNGNIDVADEIVDLFGDLCLPAVKSEADFRPSHVPLIVEDDAPELDAFEMAFAQLLSKNVYFLPDDASPWEIPATPAQTDSASGLTRKKSTAAAQPLSNHIAHRKRVRAVKIVPNATSTLTDPPTLNCVDTRSAVSIASSISRLYVDKPDCPTKVSEPIKLKWTTLIDSVYKRDTISLKWRLIIKTLVHYSINNDAPMLEMTSVIQSYSPETNSLTCPAVLSAEAECHNRLMHALNGNICISGCGFSEYLQAQWNKLMHALNGNIDTVDVYETLLRKIPSRGTQESLSKKVREYQGTTSIATTRRYYVHPFRMKTASGGNSRSLVDNAEFLHAPAHAQVRMAQNTALTAADVVAADFVVRDFKLAIAVATENYTLPTPNTVETPLLQSILTHLEATKVLPSSLNQVWMSGSPATDLYMLARTSQNETCVDLIYAKLWIFLNRVFLTLPTEIRSWSTELRYSDFASDIPGGGMSYFYTGAADVGIPTPGGGLQTGRPYTGGAIRQNGQTAPNGGITGMVYFHVTIETVPSEEHHNVVYAPLELFTAHGLPHNRALAMWLTLFCAHPVFGNGGGTGRNDGFHAGRHIPNIRGKEASTRNLNIPAADRGAWLCSGSDGLYVPGMEEIHVVLPTKASARVKWNTAAEAARSCLIEPLMLFLPPFLPNGATGTFFQDLGNAFFERVQFCSLNGVVGYGLRQYLLWADTVSITQVLLFHNYVTRFFRHSEAYYAAREFVITYSSTFPRLRGHTSATNPITDGLLNGAAPSAAQQISLALRGMDWANTRSAKSAAYGLSQTIDGYDLRMVNCHGLAVDISSQGDFYTFGVIPDVNITTINKVSLGLLAFSDTSEIPTMDMPSLTFLFREFYHICVSAALATSCVFQSLGIGAQFYGNVAVGNSGVMSAAIGRLFSGSKRLATQEIFAKFRKELCGIDTPCFTSGYNMFSIDRQIPSSTVGRWRACVPVVWNHQATAVDTLVPCIIPPGWSCFYGYRSVSTMYDYQNTESTARTFKEYLGMDPLKASEGVVLAPSQPLRPLVLPREYTKEAYQLPTAWLTKYFPALSFSGVGGVRLRATNDLATDVVSVYFVTPVSTVGASGGYTTLINGPTNGGALVFARSWEFEPTRYSLVGMPVIPQFTVDLTAAMLRVMTGATYPEITTPVVGNDYMLAGEFSEAYSDTMDSVFKVIDSILSTGNVASTTE